MVIDEDRVQSILDSAFEYAGVLRPDRDPYEYCSADGEDRFTTRGLYPCTSCLAANNDLSFMVNCTF